MKGSYRIEPTLYFAHRAHTARDMMTDDCYSKEGFNESALAGCSSLWKSKRSSGYCHWHIGRWQPVARTFRLPCSYRRCCASGISTQSDFEGHAQLKLTIMLGVDCCCGKRTISYLAFFCFCHMPCPQTACLANFECSYGTDN
eukprot:6183943-Pleurochrysis_carterae.AAC.1